MTQQHEDILTLTVGADNLLNLLKAPANFGCITPFPSNPASCGRTLTQTLNDVNGDVKRILITASPHASMIFITGYYHIYADARPNTTQGMVNGDIDLLNNAIRSAVRSVNLPNVRYVDIAPTFEGHAFNSASSWLVKRTECGGLRDFRDFRTNNQLGDYVSQLLVNPLKSDDQKRLEFGCLLFPGVHPSARGQRGIADTILADGLRVFVSRLP